MSSTRLNPRWVAFCQAHGHRPRRDMRLEDEYCAWISERLARFRRQTGLEPGAPLTPKLEAEFTDYLKLIAAGGKPKRIRAPRGWETKMARRSAAPDEVHP